MTIREYLQDAEGHYSFSNKMKERFERTILFWPSWLGLDTPIFFKTKYLELISKNLQNNSLLHSSFYWSSLPNPIPSSLHIFVL